MWSNGTRTNRIVTCTIKPYKVSFTPKNATCKTRLKKTKARVYTRVFLYLINVTKM